MEPLISLAPCDLRSLAAALRTGRLTEPFSLSGLQRFVSKTVACAVAESLQELAASGLSAPGIARSLDLLAAGLAQRPPLDDLVDLVTTGPDNGGVATRDTSVVVSNLFRSAEQSVMLAGYAVYQGQKVFRALADRMLERAALKVRMYLDIQRKVGDTSAPCELVQAFRHWFCTAQWPPERPLPEVYYNARSLVLEHDKRNALHAKCVVVDGQRVFVSSANFTEAAQQRNIEVGILLNSAAVAERLNQFFIGMEVAGHLERVL
jgi:hypothetical protein